MDNRGTGDEESTLSEPGEVMVKADYGISITEQQQEACIIVTCPLTQQPLVDPVVNPVDGVSYERSAIVNEEDKDLYYPNRALKEYIDATTANTTASSSQHAKNVLDVFLCPITQDLMRDPVIDSEGNTYERSAVVGWIQKHGVSPITRKPLSIDQLYDNTTLFWVLVQEIQLRHHLDDFHQDDDDDTVQEWKKALSSPSDDDNMRQFHDVAKGTLQLPGQLQQQQQQQQPPRSVYNHSNDPERTTSSLVATTAPSLEVNSRADHARINDLVRQEQRHARRILLLVEQQKREEQRRMRMFICLSVSLSCVVCVVLLISFLQESWISWWLLSSVIIVISLLGCAVHTNPRNSLTGALNGI